MFPCPSLPPAVASCWLEVLSNLQSLMVSEASFRFLRNTGEKWHPCHDKEHPPGKSSPREQRPSLSSTHSVFPEQCLGSVTEKVSGKHFLDDQMSSFTWCSSGAGLQYKLMAHIIMQHPCQQTKRCSGQPQQCPPYSAILWNGYINQKAVNSQQIRHYASVKCISLPSNQIHLPSCHVNLN